MSESIIIDATLLRTARIRQRRLLQRHSRAACAKRFRLTRTASRRRMGEQNMARNLFLFSAIEPTGICHRTPQAAAWPPSTAQPGCASEVQTMRKPRALLAAFALTLGALLAVPVAAQDDDEREYSNARIVRLSLVDGDAQVFRPEQGEWEVARQNLPIQKSYAVATGRGRVEIEFESGGTARLDEFTELEFTELALLNGARITTLRLERGSAIFYANGEKRDVFEVLAGGRRITADRNARLRVDANGDEVLIAVLKGSVDVQFEGGRQRLSRNQEMRIGVSGVEIARHGDADEFERWAQDREEVLTASYDLSRQYVNAPFRYGVSDLSNHGYWYYTSAYGYVWQPHAIGFTPYVNGSWLWVNGFGWSWVGYEPWGWLPYHYGRWVWTGYGWAWVPGYFHRWSPAHVVWVRFGDGRYGWCPRSPHDRPGRRPHNVHVGTAVWNGGRPVVRNVDTAGGLPTVVERPSRETLGTELGFAARNPRTDRPGRGPHARSPEAEDTVAGPRSGFSGSTNAWTAQGRPSRGEYEGTGRTPVPQGDVRYDRSEGAYVNTPMREGHAAADAPRTGWGGAAGSRPRPDFLRGNENSPGPGAGGSRSESAGSASDSGPRTYGTTPRGNDPRGNDARGSGWGGRPSSSSGSSGQPVDRSSPPPRSGGSQAGASQRPSNSPPPRASSPPQQQPSTSAPRQSAPPPQMRQTPAPAPAPRQSPPRPSPRSN
jgi:hypothetical protein